MFVELDAAAHRHGMFIVLSYSLTVHHAGCTDLALCSCSECSGPNSLNTYIVLHQATNTDQLTWQMKWVAGGMNWKFQRRTGG